MLKPGSVRAKTGDETSIIAKRSDDGCEITLTFSSDTPITNREFLLELERYTLQVASAERARLEMQPQANQ